MKHNKIIYLTAFFLSLSFIFLLEASSLRLLAEDIKLPKKEEVEIELLLSASDELFEANAQTGETEEAEKTEKIQEEKVEEPKKESQEAVNKEKPDKIKMAEPEDASSENKVVEEKQDKIPAWLKNSKIDKDNSKKSTAKNKEDKFDLESYLAELENYDSADQENEVNKNSDNKSDHNLSGNELKTDEKTRENKTEGKKDTAANGNEQEVEENKVYDLRKDAKGIKKPGLKNYSQLGYPANLRKRNIEGEVIISLRIDKKGKTHNLKIAKSSDFESFDRAALEAVSDWSFEAAEKDGQKVEVIVNLPIRFKLN